MNTPLSMIRTAIALGFIAPVLSACVINSQSAATANGRAAYNDPRSNDEIAAITPASAFNQSEFPKPYVVDMMRGCLNIFQQNGANNLIAKSGKTDVFCGCTIDKDVHNFTLAEYINGNKQHWDSSKVPDSAKKSADILSKCTQSSLK